MPQGHATRIGALVSICDLCPLSCLLHFHQNDLKCSAYAILDSPECVRLFLHVRSEAVPTQSSNSLATTTLPSSVANSRVTQTGCTARKERFFCTSQSTAPRGRATDKPALWRSPEVPSSVTWHYVSETTRVHLPASCLTEPSMFSHGVYLDGLT